MSTISRIFGSYRESLDFSLNRYEEAYTSSAQNAMDFYNSFLKDLIYNYGELFKNPYGRSRMKSIIGEYFQRDDIPFIAIDGTCSKDPFNDFMVFFAAAYGVRGDIRLAEDPPSLKYERWSVDEDISFVAYVPIPYAESGDIVDSGYKEEFVVDDSSKINLSSIHTRLMQLSEIYLAYEMASSTTMSYPKLILMDMSLSSALMSNDPGFEHVRLFGHKVGSRKITREDGIVVYSHPFNEMVDLPSNKKYRRWAYLVSEFVSNKHQQIDIKDLSAKTGIPQDEWLRSLNESNAKRLFKVSDNVIDPIIDFNNSWSDSLRLFEELCDKLFHKHDVEALIYQVEDEGEHRARWMSPEDVSLLISIGLRGLIELCWSKRILLLSIAKDSSTRYFSQNYIGILREKKVFPEIEVKNLPWTDRTLLESIAFQAININCPWATTEFDSSYMSLHLEFESSNKVLRGQRGFVVNPERLFARSLVQFFNRKSKDSTLMGHVIFIDRLIDPYFDHEFLDKSRVPVIESAELGRIIPAYFGKNDSESYGQAVSLWFLTILTRNLFPEVIGYPDPLHKADWGAKSVKKRVDNLIKSSEIAFRSRPMSRLFRTTRDSSGR